MGLLKNRTAVCCSSTNGVKLCRTITWVCRSDKLRLVLNGGYVKKPPQRKVLHFVIYVRVLHNVTPLVLLQQVVVLLRLPPLHRRGIAQCRYEATTLSGFACHPSTGGELLSADTRQPPRQASPATPPQEGNCSVQIRGNHPVRLRLPPLHRRGIAQCRYEATTPSGFACHPSTGGELLSADTRQPPRQASPATPPQEGNCSVQIRGNHPVRLRLPPLQRRGIAVQIRGNHPVRLRLPPLQRRGIAQCRYEATTPSGCACHPSTGGELLSADTRQPPRQAAPATPPQEGNCSVQIRGNHPVRLRLPPLHRRGIAQCRYEATTPSGCACHPSTGGELLSADTRQPPRQAAPATPPQEGNCSVQIRGNHPVRLRLPPLHRRGIAQCRYEATTPSGCACHPSTGGELLSADTRQPPRQAAPATPPQEGNCSVQIRGNHPVRLRLPPLHRRGIAQCRYEATTPSGFAYHPSTGGELLSADTRQPPRQASPATPPQEGNCSVQIRGNHPVRLRLPPLRRRGIAQCRYEATTPSGFAYHPSTGGELLSADTRQPPRQASPATPPQEGNCSVQIRGNHPVRLRLPPLHRRGIAQCRYEATTPSGFACHPSTEGELLSADTRQPPRQASPATPPQERNCSVQIRSNHPVRLRLPPLHRRGIAQCRYEATTPSGFACHPSEGGELLSADTRQPPRQASPVTPPQERNCSVQIRGNHPVRLRLSPLHRRGIAQCRYEATTPSGFACHPSTGGELLSADTRQPPRQASPATPPQEGNCSVQIRGNHPVRLRLPPLHRRGIAQCRYEATTPSGFACHPSTGGELLSADTRQPPRQASPATPPQEGNCSVQIRGNHPVRLRLPPLHRRGIVIPQLLTIWEKI